MSYFSEKASKEIELLTITEVSKLLKMKESKIRNAIFKRQIPYLKIGGLVRFRRDQLLSWLENQSVTPRFQ